jgi:thioredoxin 2
MSLMKGLQSLLPPRHAFFMGRSMADPLHVVCPGCATVNRVLPARLGAGAKCGKCKEPLFRAAPLEVRDADFDVHVGRSELPVVVDFWAPWCGPCRMMAPHFERAAAEIEPAARLAKLNTEESPQTAARYGIRGIPTLAVFRNGTEIARQSGAMDYGTLMRWIRSSI